MLIYLAMLRVILLRYLGTELSLMKKRSSQERYYYHLYHHRENADVERFRLIKQKIMRDIFSKRN